MPSTTHSLSTQNASPTLAYTAWGKSASTRYETLAQTWRPLFAQLRAQAVERELERRLPKQEIQRLRDTGFTRLRLPTALGGQDASLPELFNLLIELGEADTNLVNILRAHFGFTEEVLNAAPSEWRSYWLEKLAQGDLIGAGLSESGPAKVGSFATRLEHSPQGLVLNGQKFYTTGSLFADWVSVAAQDAQDNTRYLQVPRHAKGVDIIDDWDGFGQRLTASGTALFSTVHVEQEWVKPNTPRFPYTVPFYQLVHIASLAGIGRAQASDVALRLRQRDRIYSHGNSASAASDPQLLQVVGRAQAAAYAVSALSLQAAHALQIIYELNTQDQPPAHALEHAITQAHIEVDQALSVSTRLILEASTDLFDALGASATLRQAGLDRYWRNARTICSHNPRVYRERQVGNYAVNGQTPPLLYRVGKQ